MTRWAILTGEYPPQPGGVGEYTRCVAAGLAAAGDVVDVFCPPLTNPPAALEDVPGVRVHWLPDNFRSRGRAEADRILNISPPDRVLVQYVPHAFGCKAMNVPFVSWVTGKLRRKAPIWVMFHEVAYPFSFRRIREFIIGGVTRRMAGRLARAAEQVFVSIPAWETTLRELGPISAPVRWCPIPSLVPPCDDDAAVIAAARKQMSIDDRPVVGHFGTYSSVFAPLLTGVLHAVLKRHPTVRVALIGRGSQEYSERFLQEHPEFAERLFVGGQMDLKPIADHICACDLLLQPYVDGISSRRSSAMPALAHGVALVSNLGALSEPLWKDSGVALAAAPDPDLIADACLALLGDDEKRRAAALRGTELYQAEFTLDRTLRLLRDKTVMLSDTADG